MTQSPMLTVRLYRSVSFIASLLLLTTLGIAALLVCQRFWNIPDLAQYAFLTITIAGAFIIAPRLSTHPATVHIGGGEITIEPQGRAPYHVKAENIAGYARYEELLLYSLKVSLYSGDTLSVISFKGQDRSGFDALVNALEALPQSHDSPGATPLALERRTFYSSRAKPVITLTLLVIYTACSLTLILRGAFTSWNPVATYFYWMLPIAFFIKMWRSR
ncbi:MAG: hypothetical protein JW892_05625 [Anaerolineae bacterium]|nr:hypothetical protein [Anaerolineae bacterium]